MADAKKTEEAEVKKPAGFDLASLKQVDTSVVPLKHPTTGEELEGCSVEIYNPESQHFREETTRMRARITDFLSRNRGAKTEKKQEVTEQWERKRNIACIKGFTGLVLNGEQLSVADTCEEAPWAYNQAVAAFDDQANFIKG